MGLVCEWAYLYGNQNHKYVQITSLNRQFHIIGTLDSVRSVSRTCGPNCTPRSSVIRIMCLKNKASKTQSPVPR